MTQTPIARLVRPDGSTLVGPVVISVIAAELCALLLRAMLHGELLERGIDPLFAATLSYLAIPAVLVPLLGPTILANRQFVSELVRPSGSSRRTIVLAIGLGLFLRVGYLAGLLAVTAFGLTERSGGPSPIPFTLDFRCPSPGTLLAHVVALSLIAPVVEEVLNRGLVLHALLKRGAGLAIVLSSLWFAASHSPAAMPAAFISGLYLGALTLRSGSLLPAVVAHATFNTLIVLDWLCLSIRWQPAIPQPAAALLALAICTAALAGALHLLGKTMPMNHHRHRHID